ncbi:hypothetical protein [Noviherbaspirillum malthae]|uniref:hypothetical protein n=1 Tax=Noviherbaspirillum malthae TaxID=1260987 RepID=UPI00188ED400|nr:hypothetical protein [Noviherbaspirillum malthae]
MIDLNKSSKGLVVKGVDRVLAVKARHEEVVTNKVYTWQISQTLRKDVNVVVAKMFHKRLRFENQLRIRALLVDLQEEAQALIGISQKLEMPAKALSDTVSHKVFCEEDKMMIEALVDVDRALAKMLNSEMAEVAVDNCALFFAAFGRLKNFVFDNHKFTRDAAAQSQEANVESQNGLTLEGHCPGADSQHHC